MSDVNSPRSSRTETEHSVEDDSARRVSDQVMQHDSLVTVRLSEPPALTVDTKLNNQEQGMHRNGSISEEVEDNHQPDTQKRDSDGEGLGTAAGSEPPRAGDTEPRRASEDSEGAEDEVNWEQLEKNEEEEPKTQDSDDVSDDPRNLLSGSIMLT